MELLLFSEMTIKEVNKNFQKSFPYLKIKFFNYNTIPGQISLWDDELDENTMLGEIVGSMGSTTIEVEPTGTVAELEQNFQMQLGLFVKVYQNINGVWSEAPCSGQLELDRQNAAGNHPFRYSYNKYTLFL